MFGWDSIKEVNEPLKPNEQQDHAVEQETTNTQETEQKDIDAAAAEQSGEAERQETDAAEPETEADAGALSAEAQRLQQELEEAHNRLLRAQADFDNFRKRTRQEKEDLAKYASFKLVEQLLPVVDNFDRALQTSRESRDFDAMLKGVEMTFRQLDQVLAQEGLLAMESVGKPFDPERHQAIMQVESDEYEEGIVVEEIQKGYVLKDRVLRPAMVKVSG